MGYGMSAAPRIQLVSVSEAVVAAVAFCHSANSSPPLDSI